MTDTGTKRDPETNLPIVGGGVNKKKVPIDPKLLPELRDLESKMEASDAIAREVGYSLILSLGTATNIGMQAALNRKAWMDYVTKIVGMMGINMDAVEETDPENGLLVLK